MPYDPFAPPPQMMPPQVQPPVAQPPLSPNNALAPVMTATGPPAGSPAPMGGSGTAGMTGGRFPGRRQARMDWRSARPDHPFGPMDPASIADWQQSMHDWRDLRPDHANGFTYAPPADPAAAAPVDGATPVDTTMPIAATPLPVDPIMMPGGGTTGAPLQPDPRQRFGDWRAAAGSFGMRQPRGYGF